MTWLPNVGDRPEQMARQYHEGLTLAEVGKAHGISRQRVHQLLKKAGVPRRPTGLPPKRLVRPRVAKCQ
jgi:hypothetical protein